MPPKTSRSTGASDRGTQHRVILLRPEAPQKPAAGADCNGCGVCCAAEPCPLGVLLSRRLTGACAALGFDEARARYRCGAVTEPRRWLPWLPAAWASALVRSWIAASHGCDSTLLPQEARPSH